MIQNQKLDTRNEKRESDDLDTDFDDDTIIKFSNLQIIKLEIRNFF